MLDYNACVGYGLGAAIMGSGATGVWCTLCGKLYECSVEMSLSACEDATFVDIVTPLNMRCFDGSADGYALIV